MVLIVAECNVNFVGKKISGVFDKVLIVAECNVNVENKIFYQ